MEKNIDEGRISDSIEQAAALMTTAYEIVTGADPDLRHANDDLFKNIDRKKTLTYLSKIAIMCKRLELEFSRWAIYIHSSKSAFTPIDTFQLRALGSFLMVF